MLFGKNITIEKVVEYGLYLLIFLLPWQTRWIFHLGNLNGGYWEYGSYSLYGIDILLGLLLILSLIWYSKFQILPPQRDPASAVTNSVFCIPRIWRLITFLALVSLLSILWAPGHGLAFYSWLKLCLGIGLCWLVATMKFDFKKFSWAIMWAGFIQSGLAIWQFFTQSTFSSKWLGMAAHHAGESGTFVIETALGRWLRAYGSFPHPNILAGFLVVVLLLIIGLYLKTESWSKKITLMAIFTLNFIGLLVTLSRAGILSFLLCFILFWCFYWREKLNLLKFTFVLLLIVSIFFLIFGQLFFARAMSHGRLEAYSNQERLASYSQAWQMIKAHPLLGVGIGNYTLALFQDNPGLPPARAGGAQAGLPSQNYQPTHNVFLLVFAELGIVGLAIFLLVLFYLIKFAFQSRSLPLAVIFLAMLFISLFDHYPWTLPFGIMILWLIIGLMLKRSLENN